MKEPLKCIGDVDALIKLNFYKVTSSWLEKQIPSGFEGITSVLTEKQLKDIIIKEQWSHGYAALLIVW